MVGWLLSVRLYQRASASPSSTLTLRARAGTPLAWIKGRQRFPRSRIPGESQSKRKEDPTMFDPRHPMRLSILTLVALLAIAGCGSDDSGTPLNPTPPDQAPPAPPAGLRIDWQMHGKFALAWNANGEADLTGYRVYLYSPDPSRGNAYTCITGARPLWKNSLTVTGIEGNEYIFRVTAVDAGGNESPMSESVFYAYSASIGQRPADSGTGSEGPHSSSPGGRPGAGNGLPIEQGGTPNGH